MHGIRNAKITPRMSAWSSEPDAITTRAERAIRNSIEPWSIEAQERINLRSPPSLSEKMTNAAQVSLAFFADCANKQQ